MIEIATLNKVENILQGIKFVQRSDKDITQEDIAGFEDFLSEEMKQAYEYVNGQPSGSVDAYDRLSEVGIHAMAHKSLKEDKKNGNTFNLLLAEDAATNKIVGYYFCTIGNKNNTGDIEINDKIGVSQKMQGKGIGKELLKRSILTLRNSGMTSYLTDARNKVVGMYNSLGVPVENLGSLSESTMSMPGSRLRVIVGRKS